MSMTRVFGRLLAASIAATVSVLFVPAAAHAACTIIVGDIDKNGIPDIRFLGSNVTSETITVNVGPSSTVVTGCGSKTYPQQFGTYFFKPNGGTDTVNFNVVGTWVGARSNVAVQAGIGVAKVTIGGSGAMTAGSSLIVEVNAMQGIDTLAVIPPSLNASYLDVRTNLGPGRDALIVKLDNPITGGSAVNISGDLGGDNNIYKFSQTALLNGTVNVNVLSGAGVDTGTFTLAGPIGPSGRLYYKTNLGYGNDGFDGNVNLPLVSIAAGGEVHVDIAGNAGADTLTLSRKGTTGGLTTTNAGLLDVFLGGNSESDVIRVDLAGGGFVTDGTLRLRTDGGSGNDTLDAQIDAQATSLTPNLDVLLHGGAGADRLTVKFKNDGPNILDNYGAAGAALLDGGLDVGDVCTTTGNGLVHERNCEL
jgi:hypothetical protein